MTWGSRGLVAAGALVGALALTVGAQAAVPDTWTRWSSPAPDVTVRSLDFLGPTLFAGGESNGVFTAPTPAGPWSQQNGGLDPQTGAQSVRQVKLSPNGLLYAATSAGLFSAPPAGTWSPVGQGSGARKLNMGGIQSIVFNGPSGADMTAAVAGTAGSGVYYSSDSGANWYKASGIPTGENVFFLTSAPAGTPLYAAADDGVFVSSDAGRSWTLQSDGIPPGETTLRISVEPDNPAHLYASTSSGVFRSTNSGSTWARAEGSEVEILPAAAKRALLLTPPLSGQFGQNRAVVGTQQGAWATIDAGAHWGKMSSDASAQPPNMGDRDVWSLELGGAPPTLVAGTAGFGAFSLPLQPIEAGTVTIGPVSSLRPGTRITSTLDDGWAGTRPFFFSYEWRRCVGAACTPTTAIPGATGASYVIPSSDAGVRVRYSLLVTARNLVKPTSVSDTSNVTADADINAAPGTTPRPSLVVAEQPNLTPATSQPWGTVFTISNGKWRTEASPTDITAQSSFEYRWLRCTTSGANCTEIPGATGQTYTSTALDIAHKLQAYIRATRAGVASQYWLAGQTSDLTNKFPVNTVAPKIVGDPFTGVRLSSAAGGWDGFEMTFERRWLRCGADGLGCAPIDPVVTGSTYDVAATDLGKRLQLEVTAVAPDASQDRRTTALSALTPVIADPPAPKVKIKKPKKLRRGAKLKLVLEESAGFLDPRYQWLRGKKKLKKATKRTYKLTRKDLGKKVACQVTLTAANGPDVIVTTKPVKIPKEKKRRK